MKTVTASDSKLTNKEVRDYIRYPKQWIQENYYDYDDEVFEYFIPELDRNNTLAIHLAELIDDLFEKREGMRLRFQLL